MTFVPRRLSARVAACAALLSDHRLRQRARGRAGAARRRARLLLHLLATDRQRARGGRHDAPARLGVRVGRSPDHRPCGLPAPAPTTDSCVVVDGVDWVVRELTDGTAVTFGREPAIEVLVPQEHGPVPLLLPAFAGQPGPAGDGAALQLRCLRRVGGAQRNPVRRSSAREMSSSMSSV